MSLAAPASSADPGGSLASDGASAAPGIPDTAIGPPCGTSGPVAALDGKGTEGDSAAPPLHRLATLSDSTTAEWVTQTHPKTGQVSWHQPRLGLWLDSPTPPTAREEAWALFQSMRAQAALAQDTSL